MQRGEVFKMIWSDVDFGGKIIHVRAMNTKTLQSRMVPISERLDSELKTLWEKSSKDLDATVFGIRDDVNVAFRNACKDAGIEDLRKQDLRHTFATRMVEAGLPGELLEKILGAQPKTTFKYFEVTPQTLKQVANALNAFNAEGRQAE